jgi:aryl-alcohol dehydrogenase-like predicted oxidoreductase
LTGGEEWGWGSSPSESQAILAECLDLGGNFVDTANIYTNGHSEKIIGDYFSQNKARRVALS